MTVKQRNLVPWLLAALALWGCEGSSSTAGGPTAPSPMIVFIPDRAAGGGSVSMRAGGGSTASVLELEIVATDLVNVQTMDFVLAYPGDLLRFDGFRTGPFLGAGVSAILEPVAAGSLNVLMTRLDPSGASGSGVVLTVILSAAGSGEGRLDFVAPEAADPFGLEISDVDWIGGAVRVVL